MRSTQCVFLKKESSISTDNINKEKMNITDLSGLINGVKLQRIIQVGIITLTSTFDYSGYHKNLIQ